LAQEQNNEFLSKFYHLYFIYHKNGDQSSGDRDRFGF